MPSSRLDCPLSLKTPNMGNPGVDGTIYRPPRSTNLDKIFDQALILWCGMVTCGRAEIPVLGRDMGALGFKFPTTHRAYGGAGSELRRAEGGMVRSSEGTQRRSFSSLG